MYNTTKLVVLVVFVGLVLFYFLLERLGKVKTDEKIRGPKGYFQIFKKSISIIKSNTWMLWIPMGVMFISSLFVAMQHICFGCKDSGYLSLFHQYRPQHIVVYWLIEKWEYLLPLIVALILVFGYFKFKKLVKSVRNQGQAGIFHGMQIPVIVFSIFVIIIYALLFVKSPCALPFDDSSADKNSALFFLTYNISVIWLGSLFFAFLNSGIILVTYRTYSIEDKRIPLSGGKVFIAAEKFFYFFVAFNIFEYPLFSLYSSIYSHKLLSWPLYIVISGLPFIFVPLAMVGKNRGLIQGVVENFKFWKNQFLRIMVLLMIFVVIGEALFYFRLHLLPFLDSLLGCCGDIEAFYFSVMEYIVGWIEVAIRLCFDLLLVVSLAGFYCKLAGSEK